MLPGNARDAAVIANPESALHQGNREHHRSQDQQEVRQGLLQGSGSSMSRYPWGSVETARANVIAYRLALPQPAAESRTLPGSSGGMRGRKMRIALVLITRNENPYLWEWCAFHHRLGVDELLIVDDKSALSVRDTVASFEPELREAIRVFDCPFSHATKQQATYRRMLREHGSRFDFMGFIDTDEFIIPKADGGLPELLEGFARFGGLGIHWQMFGSNGLREREKSGSVIDAFTRKAVPDHPSNRHIKSIVNPRRVSTWRVPRNPHCFSYKRGFFCVNEEGAPSRGPSRSRFPPKGSGSTTIFCAAEVNSWRSASAAERGRGRRVRARMVRR